MSRLKETAIAIARIILGMFVLIEGLTVLVFINYTSAIGGFYDDKATATYEDSYENGYAQTYDASYQEAYSEAYDKGYDKGYEIGLGYGSKEGVNTRVELYNPTYKELTEFLTSDGTDSCSFVTGEFVCYDFAARLNNNAEANGIRAAYVHIRSERWGHAIVVFETVDRGFIFIEPQSDKKVQLVMGEPFPWHLIGAVRPLNAHDPLLEITITW